MEKFCLSATNITHFIHVNETDFGHVTKHAFIFEHDLRYEITNITSYRELSVAKWVPTLTEDKHV